MSSLKMVSDEQADSMMFNSPIKISDAASMMRRKISNNERPLEKEVLQRNNRLVDEWYERVLKKLANTKGCIESGRVATCFHCFIEGREITQHQKYKQHLMQFPDEQVLFWINFLKTKSIGELHEAGTGVVSAAWSIVTNSIRYRFAEEKWKTIFSKSDDPLVWDKLANDNPHVFLSKSLPFDLTPEDLSEMESKVKALVQNIIAPH